MALLSNIEMQCFFLCVYLFMLKCVGGHEFANQRTSGIVPRLLSTLFCFCGGVSYLLWNSTVCPVGPRYLPISTFLALQL